MQTVYQKNVKDKIAFNNVLIKQIDDLIFSYSQNKPTGSVTISENSGLNDIITKKDDLIKENQNIMLHYVEYDRIIKDQSIVSNQINTSGLNNKMKLILPFLFVFLYLVGYLFNILYKKQLARINK